MTNDELPENVQVFSAGDNSAGFYSMVFPGGSDRGKVLLPLLGFEYFNDLGRFRDAWVEKDDQGQLRIHIYTRNGGGNRAVFAEVITRLQAHPLYERDADDGFDSTYASFWFRVSDDLVDFLNRVAIPPVDTAARWRDFAGRMAGSGGE